MAEIPRIPNVAPTQHISQQTYRVTQTSDRPGGRRPGEDKDAPHHEDVVELHEETLDESIVHPAHFLDDEGGLDLAI